MPSARPLHRPEPPAKSGSKSAIARIGGARYSSPPWLGPSPFPCPKERTGRHLGRCVMSPWQRLSAESSDLLEQTGIPRKVMSRLLSALRLGVGFSVLEVGCGRGELAKFFDSLGIQCTGIDESPKNVLDARRHVPSCSFSCASVNDPLPSLRPEFDVVLVRDSSEYHRPLQSRAAYAATLRLISRLPP